MNCRPFEFQKPRDLWHQPGDRTLGDTGRVKDSAGRSQTFTYLDCEGKPKSSSGQGPSLEAPVQGFHSVAAQL